MFTIEFLEAQLKATPFIPFTVVTNAGDRFAIRTVDHADLPPQETNDHAKPNSPV
jgi:hypothetical protein